MPHNHDHGPPVDLGPAFRWAVGLNTGYVVIEGAAGWITGSLALLADAAHNLTDVAGLLIAWGAAVLAKRAVAKLLAQLDQPGGSTNLKDAIQQVAASGIHDIVVLTDGQTWEALPPLSAELDIRVSAILVGKASLDANIGHLCAMTGGNLFYTPQADVASSARLALNSMRMPHNTRHTETENGQPIKISRTFGAVEIAATWEDQPQTAEGNKDHGAFAAGLCIGMLNEEDTKTLALQEGLCTHLTSLILIDDAGEVSFGVSETRKIPLMSEQAVFRAPRRLMADDSGVRFMMRERLSPEAEELLRKRRAEMQTPEWQAKIAQQQREAEFEAVSSKIWSNNSFQAALEELPEMAAWKARKRKEIDEYLALVASQIAWETLSNRFLVGDISGMSITEQAVLAALRGHQGITKVIAKSQIEPTVFLLAWLASRYATESTQAQRFSRKVLNRKCQTSPTTARPAHTRADQP
jgi:hypothetical protein